MRTRPDRAPPGIGLEKMCDLPPDLRSVRGHLLFEYRMDAMGRVHDVRALYASVQPEGARGAFTSALAECVRKWAFQPGASGGKEAPVSYLVPFHFFRPAPATDGVGVLPDGRQYPLAWFEEVHREKIGLAETILKSRSAALLPGSLYVEIGGQGWALRANLRESDTMAIRDALEFAMRAFDAAFPASPSVPESAPLTVLVFQHEREFEQVAAFDNFLHVPGQPAGRYTSWDRTIYTAVGDLPIPLVSGVMAHEATHHLVWHRLYAGGKKPPLWLNEGLAAFIQCLKPGPGGAIDLAALDRGKYLRYPQVWTRPAEEYLELLRETAAGKRLPPLADLLSGRLDDRFFGEPAKLQYGVSWLLVHYLLNAEGGKYRDRFRGWVLGPSSEGDGEALAAAIGRPLAQIESDLPAYLEGLSDAPGVRRDPESFLTPRRPR